LPLYIPVPTAEPNDDIAQYVPLLLSAIEGFLQLRDVWAEDDYVDGFAYMEDLKSWVARNIPGPGSMFTGEIRMFSQPPADLPTRWLYCDGSAISRSVYAELFSVIGVDYGAGNNTTTFNIPNLVHKFPRGGAYPGTTGGADTHTLQLSEIPVHDHVVQRSSAEGGSTSRYARTTTSSNFNSPVSENAGGGEAHNNIPAYLELCPAIYAGAV